MTPQRHENRVQRRLSASERQEVTGEWRKLFNEEHEDLYPSLDAIMEMQSAAQSAVHMQTATVQ